MPTLQLQLAASGETAVSNINGLMQKMATDAVEKFGLKMAASRNTNQLVRMTKFLKSHPNYPPVVAKGTQFLLI